MSILGQPPSTGKEKEYLSTLRCYGVKGIEVARCGAGDEHSGDSREFGKKYIDKNT